jgi:hypothetical protein
MPNINKPSGFSPVKSLVGNGKFQTNVYAIPTDGSNTYAIGDVVMSRASSNAKGIRYVQKWGGATTTSALPLGIIVGFQVPGAGNSLQGVSLTPEKQWLSLSSPETLVIVADDPYLVFEAQFDSTAIAATDLSRNAAVTVTANQTSTLSQSSPQSNTVLTGPAVTATLPIRLLGAVQAEDNEVGAFARVLCKWNYHENGITAGASGTVVSYLAV